MSYEFRSARYEDVSEIAAVHVTSWNETYKGDFPHDLMQKVNQGRLQHWQNQLKNSPPWVFVALYENIVRGFIEIKILGSDFCLLNSLYVVEAFQKKGIGYNLFQMSKKQMQKHHFKKMYVEVLNNNPAKGFYEKIGAKYIRDIQKEILFFRIMISEYYIDLS